MKNVYITSLEPEGKTSIEIHVFRWEDNIKMDLNEIRCEDVDWIRLDEDEDH